MEGREQPELPHFSRSLEATMSRERRKVRNGAVQHNLQPEYKDNAQEAAGKLCRSEERMHDGVRARWGRHRILPRKAVVLTFS